MTGPPPRLPLPPATRLCQLLRVAAEREQDQPADYETAKEWELLASARAMLSIKRDVEPFPLFNPHGRQVGIGIGLSWSINAEGEIQWRFEDESHGCVDTRSCFEEILDEVGEDDDL